MTKIGGDISTFWNIATEVLLHAKEHEGLAEHVAKAGKRYMGTIIKLRKEVAARS